MPKAEGEESVFPMAPLRAGEAAVGGWRDAASLRTSPAEAARQCSWQTLRMGRRELGGPARRGRRPGVAAQWA
jgi:hypothetical protein